MRDRNTRLVVYVFGLIMAVFYLNAYLFLKKLDNNHAFDLIQKEIRSE